VQNAAPAKSQLSPDKSDGGAAGNEAAKFEHRNHALT
jgi:hypothetical protein